MSARVQSTIMSTFKFQELKVLLILLLASSFIKYCVQQGGNDILDSHILLTRSSLPHVRLEDCQKYQFSFRLLLQKTKRQKLVWISIFLWRVELGWALRNSLEAANFNLYNNKNHTPVVMIITLINHPVGFFIIEKLTSARLDRTPNRFIFTVSSLWLWLSRHELGEIFNR